MVLECIEKAIAVLQSAGIPACRGFPAGKMPHLEAVFATVSMEQATEDALTLTVQIYAPASQGGTACEDTAVLAGERLSTLGVQCRLGRCSFEGKSGVFCLPVTVTFLKVEEPPVQIIQPRVEIAGVEIANVVAVSTAFTGTQVRQKSETTEMERLNTEEKRWTVTVEDLVPARLSPQQEITTGFTVVITHPGERETYNGCCWSKVTTEATAEGTRRVRVAITCNDPVITAV